MLFKQKLLAFNKLNYDTQRYQVIWLGKKYDKVPKSRFTLCIPTYRRADQTSKLLRAVYDLRVGNSSYLKFPILVSINGDPNVYQDLINKYKSISNIQFVINKGDQTFGGNIRNLVQQCKTDYLLLMGDDDWISPGYFDLINDSLAKVSPDSIAPWFTSYMPKDYDYSKLESFPVQLCTEFGGYDDNLIKSQQISTSIHTLYEPICGRVINCAKVKHLDLQTIGYKQIFPQMNYILAYEYLKLYAIYASSDFVCVNAFEEKDKTHAGNGILTIAKGLPERILHKLLMNKKWSNSIDMFGHDWIDTVFYLSREKQILTPEFVRDIKTAIDEIDSEYKLVAHLFDELMLFPPILLLPEIYLFMHLHAKTYYAKLLFACMGLFACMLAVMLDNPYYVEELFYKKLRQQIKNSICKRPKHPQAYVLNTCLENNVHINS